MHYTTPHYELLKERTDRRETLLHDFLFLVECGYTIQGEVLIEESALNEVLRYLKSSGHFYKHSDAEIEYQIFGVHKSQNHTPLILAYPRAKPSVSERLEMRLRPDARGIFPGHILDNPRLKDTAPSKSKVEGHMVCVWRFAEQEATCLE